MPNNKLQEGHAEESALDWTEMDDQTQYLAIELGVNRLVDTLLGDGADSDLVSAVLFNVFTQRMADLNDREQYDMILTSALEEEWAEVSIH